MPISEKFKALFTPLVNKDADSVEPPLPGQ